MRTFWLDAHLDPELAPWIGSRFRVIVKTLRELGLRDATDSVLFAAARRFDAVIVTKDEDFSGLVARLGTPPQIVWLRCGDLSTIELQAVFSRQFPDVLQRLAAGEAVVEVFG